MSVNQLSWHSVIVVLLWQAQGCLDLPGNLDALSCGLWPKHIADMLQGLTWVKNGLGKRENTIFHLFQIQQVVDKGLHEQNLRQDHIEVLVDHFGVLGYGDVLKDILGPLLQNCRLEPLDEEAHRAQGSAHLMTHRRGEILLLLCLQQFSRVLDVFILRTDLLRFVYNVDYSCLTPTVQLTLDTHA